MEDSNSDKNGSFGKDKDDNYWEDVVDDSQNRTQSSLINVGKTPKAKEKLIRILVGDILISKHYWSLCRILATLIYHHKDQWLYSSFQQCSQFTY